MTGDHRQSEGGQIDARGVGEGAIRGLVRRLTLMLALRGFVRYATAWLFAWGVVVVLLRVAVDWPRHWLAWGVAGLVVAGAAAVVQAMRKRPSAIALRSLMDHRSAAGGLLMTQAERPLGDWSERMPAVEQLAVRWQARGPGLCMSLAVGFVAAAFLIPSGVQGPGVSRALASPDVAQPQEQVELLAEEELLDREQLDALQEQIDRLRDESMAEDPARTWEAMDHLRDQIEQAAEEAAQQTLAQTAELTRMQMLAEALAEQGHELDEALYQEAMETLAEMVEEAAAKSEALDAALGAALRSAAAGRSLSEAQLRELAEAMEARKGELRERLERMCEARLADERDLEKCDSLGMCDSAGFCDVMSKFGGEMSVRKMLELAASGGINDDGGLSPMTFRDEATREGEAGFEPQMLSSEDRAMDESQLVGVSAAPPEVDDEAGGASSGGALGATDAEAGGSAHQVLPRHRQAVQRYFERDE
ncbi:MAG: hypothetical protein WD009_07010 [Phycisphaeraceae bacterium]